MPTRRTSPWRTLPLLAVLLIPLQAQSADLPQITWGDFIVDESSSTKAKPWSFTQAFDHRTIAFLFDDLEAHADVKIEKASSKLAGHFNVVQSDFVECKEFAIDLRGNVTKSKGSEGHLAVNVGLIKKDFSWGLTEEVSKEYLEHLVFSCEGGKIPSPFVISAEATATRNAEGDFALVTLDSIDFSFSVE